MNDRCQLSGAGPESYERYQVPSVFGPLAELFLPYVGLQKGQRVLDAACGTGVVVRQAAELLGETGSAVAIDLNAGMLEVAAANAPATGAAIEWRQGDVAALPCEDEEFDAVLCQQGLQFFPDKSAALTEMHRVLKSGGTLGLCVWRGIEHSPCHSAILAALTDHAGADIAQKIKAPFSFGSPDGVRSALSDVGFTDVSIHVEDVIRRLLPAAESIPGLLASTPVGPEVANLPEQTRDAIVEQVAEALAEYREGDGFKVPQSTHIATASKRR